MTRLIKINSFFILSLLFLFSPLQSAGMAIDIPTVVAGKAKLTGRIMGGHVTDKNSISVNITVLYPITGGYAKYKALVDQSGRFSFNVDVETNISLITLTTSLKPDKYLLAKLKSDSVNNINIAYNTSDYIKNIDITPNMTQNDVTLGVELIGKMIDHKSRRVAEPLHEKSTDYFLNYVKTIVSERLEILNRDTLVSKGLKEVLSKDFRLFMYNAHVFDYQAQMMLNYSTTDADQNKKPDIQKVDRRYYHFLKDFKLNDPQYLLCFTFMEVQKTILQNEIIGLPSIGESDIPSWLASVKAILSEVVGFDNGPYYDILAANAYGRQLNEEVKPLTEKQKNNISSYWKNGEYAKILFRKNQQVIELDKLKSPTVVNDISMVSADKVMETIVAKHKGKVIFIDLWATWCGPCIDAMQQFRNTKDNFHNKDVAFVYLTNASSPRKLWEERIQGIGNQHYYLTDSQWKYIMNNFNFDSIPSYLLFNKEGTLTNKFTGFPGNEKVRDMINNLL